MINIAYSKTALVKILKESGYSHPLLPLAVGILMEAYESGEGPGGPVLNPLGSLVAEASGKPHQKRKRSAAAKKRDRAYGKAFKRLESKYKKKSGGWKKDGFKRCAAAARKAIK